MFNDIESLRAIAADFRQDAADYMDGTLEPPREMSRDRAYRAACRLARRYDAQAATIARASRGADVPPSSFGATCLSPSRMW